MTSREELVLPAENEPKYVDAREAARLLGVSQRTVRNLVGQQRLEIKTEGEGAATRLMVSLASIRSLRSEGQQC
jgi:plasmid maintenance system antidote protein VapI